MSKQSDHIPPTTHVEVPVLIVGSGPAGLTTALALAKTGIRSMVVTRHAGLAHTPRAHITNQRTLEILADLGIENEILEVGDRLEDIPYNVFLMTLAGPELARTTAWGAGTKDQARYRAASRHLPLNVPQHRLEPVLAAAARDTGLVDIRHSHEFLSLAQDTDGVNATVLDRTSGSQLEVRAKYLVGADGARSRVMSEVGLSVRGETGLGTQCFAWISADLSTYVAHRPGELYWSVDPHFVTWIAVSQWDEWVVGWPAAEAATPEEVVARVRDSVGDPHLAVEIKSVSTWTINHAAADVYSAGRVFCVGDAVHQHPPTNGLGSNTSIADGYNLAWKLHLVLTGVAGDGLLDTYTTERAPVGRQIVDRAFTSLREVFSIGPIAGLSPDMTLDEKWAAVRSLDLATEDARDRREALREAMKLMDYNFNAHGVELGYRYSGDAILEPEGPDGGAVVPDPGTTDDLVYVPSTAPGEHLPHVWLERNRRRFSTADLVGVGRFTLFTGPGGGTWSEGAELAARAFGFRIDVCVVGADAGYRDPCGDWAAISGIGSHGCLLVRPDGHVAWRTEASPNPRRLLEVLAAILQRPVPRPQRAARSEPSRERSAAHELPVLSPR